MKGARRVCLSVEGFLTRGRSFYDAQMTLSPVADAAATGPARPFLDTGVHGLRVEGIAMPVCEPDPRGAFRLRSYPLLARHMRRAVRMGRAQRSGHARRSGDLDVLHRDLARLGLQVIARPIGFAAAVVPV